MALIACPECKSSVSDQAGSCPQCGYPLRAQISVRAPGSTEPPKRLHPDYVRPERAPIVQGRTTQHIVKTAKNRGIYIILGLFLGFFGIHNFYAGYHGRGLAQLLVVLVLGWFVIGLVIVCIWVIIELFTVSQDATGDQMV